MRTTMIVVAVLALAACGTAAHAQTGVAPSRGELLYATHCIGCHTTQVHWRQGKLATDWSSLNVQVRRWAKNSGLGWSDDEIADVARYLNATQYRFKSPAGTEVGHGDSAPPIARAN